MNNSTHTVEETVARPMSDEAKVPNRPVLVYFKQHGWLRVEWGSSHLEDDEITPENGIWMVDDFKHGPYSVRGYCDGDDTHYAPLPAPPGSLASHSTPAGEDVERVARAIYEAEPAPLGMEHLFGWEAQKTLNGPDWIVYSRARAAIAAMPSLPNTDAHELVEALTPFARFIQLGGVENWNDLELPPNVKDFVNLGDFRRAAAALTKMGEKL